MGNLRADISGQLLWLCELSTSDISSVSKVACMGTHYYRAPETSHNYKVRDELYQARPQSKFPTRPTASKPYIARSDCAYVIEQ
jgi:hypothetical protein